jgi:hypothetical protein
VLHAIVAVKGEQNDGARAFSSSVFGFRSASRVIAGFGFGFGF